MQIASNQKGFSLIEVMVAFLSFSVFYVVFTASQTKSLQDSYYIEREVTLNYLCELILNEIMLNPPIFQESLVMATETKPFREDQWKNYEYTVEYRRFEIPNLFNLTQGMGQGEEEGAQQRQSQLNTRQQNPFAAFEGIFDRITEGIHESIWQIQVTVRDKETDLSWSLSTWLRNHEYQMNIGQLIQSATGQRSGGGGQGEQARQ